MAIPSAIWVMKRILALLYILLVITGVAHAQKYLGVATGNWGGLNAVYLNPANVADSRDRLSIEVFSLNAGVDNNLGKIDINKGLSRFFNGGLDDINDVFKFSNQSKFSLLAPYGEVRGPGFTATIGRKHGIAFSTRLRGINQFSNFDQSLYRTITDSAYARSQNGDVTLTAKEFNWTAHVWGEVQASYGVVVLEKGRHFLKAGATLRYLSGIGFLGLKGNNLDAKYSSGQDSFYANNTDLEYASNIFSASSALRSDLGVNNFSDRYKNSNGNGIGGDIGIVYNYIEDTNADRYDMDGSYGVYDPAKNRYKFSVSASVTDIGHINYKAENNFGINVRGEGYMTGKGFSDNVQNVDDFKAYALQQGFTADTFKRSTKLYMPAALQVNVDYHIHTHYYVNALYFGNLANRNNFGNSFYSQFTVTPRYETRKYMVSLPITYSLLTNNFKTGLGLRAWGCFLGSDDLLGLFTKRQYGINIYAGAAIRLPHRSMKDTDGDHVSDFRDKCRKEYGTWERKGCPDPADNGQDKDEEETKGK